VGPFFILRGNFDRIYRIYRMYKVRCTCMGLHKKRRFDTRSDLHFCPGLQSKCVAPKDAFA